MRNSNPGEENHQKWRVLWATFDSSIDSHCVVQKFYFDDRGMLQRHDYFTDVAKDNAAHYCMDYKTFDGLSSQHVDGWFHVERMSSPRQVVPQAS